MSKGDLISLRQDFESQFDRLNLLLGTVNAATSNLDERMAKLEKDLERLRMSVTALNNLVKGNVR